jgi:hypothetical protein
MKSNRVDEKSFKINDNNFFKENKKDQQKSTSSTAHGDEFVVLDQLNVFSSGNIFEKEKLFEEWMKSSHFKSTMNQAPHFCSEKKPDFILRMKSLDVLNKIQLRS